MKLDKFVKQIDEAEGSSINLKNKNDVLRLAGLVAAKGFPPEFNVLYKTSAGVLDLKFNLYDKHIPSDEDFASHIIEFDYRIDKQSYARIQEMEKKLKDLPESEDPDGEKYDTFSSEASVDGFKFYGEYSGKPTKSWGILD